MFWRREFSFSVPATPQTTSSTLKPPPTLLLLSFLAPVRYCRSIGRIHSLRGERGGEVWYDSHWSGFALLSWVIDDRSGVLCLEPSVFSQRWFCRINWMNESLSGLKYILLVASGSVRLSSFHYEWISLGDTHARSYSRASAFELTQIFIRTRRIERLNPTGNLVRPPKYIYIYISCEWALQR